MIQKRKYSKTIYTFLVCCVSLVLIFSSCNIVKKVNNETIQPKESISKEQVKKIRKDFNYYLAEVFKSEVTTSTVNLHYTLAEPKNYGITEYPITYGHISAKQDMESIVMLENMKASIKKFDKKLLSLEQKMTYDILLDFAQKEINNADLYLYHEILKPSTGIQAELPVLMAEYTFYNEKDVLDYLGLLKITPDYFAQIISFEKAKASAGLFMSDFALNDVINQCKNFIVNPEENYLIDTFNDKIDKISQISEVDKLKYKEENKAAILEYLIPSYEILISTLEALKGTGKNELGLCKLERGKEYYEYLVGYYTGSNKTVKEMQKLTQVQRARDIKEVTELINKNPDLALQCTSYSFAQSDPRMILEELQSKMLKDFPEPPSTSFDIKYVHSSLEEHMAPAFYLTAPIDDISQNAIYINGSSNYEKMKLYTTLAHEGYPGHMYQNLMERSLDIPPIRNLISNAGYTEGWATYVEMMSYYYADLDKQLTTVLQKDQSAMLSLYATADMGIHYDGWDLNDTKSFFAKFQITNEEAVKEIFNLIVEEPAHYLKYYIGYIEFLDLKEYAKELYKEDFNEYKFNEALMNMGSAPFYILKEYLPTFYKK